jgi:hypothetical protein
MTLKVALGAGFFALMFLALACSRSNNLLLGEVEAKVGSHEVKVTDCYRTSVDPPLETKERDGSLSYRFTPCRDADVMIRHDRLMVNGVSYGPISPDESILVDHGVVSIDGRRAPGRQAHL